MSAERKAIYISDLDRCQPGTAISDKARHRHWRAIPYEAEGVSGTMVVAGIECNAPTLTLPLGHARMVCHPLGRLDQLGGQGGAGQVDG